MINHARTLLLNQPGKLYMPGIIGEEYIPANYSPVALPSYVITPRRIIFGTDPDKVFLNFRAWELLSLAHETELAEFIYELDPRITYWPQNRTDFFTQTSASASLKKVRGYSRARAYLKGQPAADNSRGRAFSEYFIQLTSNSGDISASITAESDTYALTADIEPDSESSNFSQWLSLPNNNLEIQFSDIVPDSRQSLLLEQIQNPLLTQDYEILSLESGELLPFTAPPRMSFSDSDDIIAQWQLQIYTRPADAIKICLPKLDILGEPLFLELFGVRNDIQPYSTFKNIWFDHPAPNYRLAAFILAMIYRTNEIRS
jgi:hypothetical protein